MTKTKSTQDAFSNGAKVPFDAVAAAGRQNFESLVTASNIMTKGYGDIGRAWFEFAKLSMEQGAETAKAVMGAKSIDEVMALQTGFAKTSLDRYVSESNRLAEMSIKTTSEAMAPLTESVESAVGKFSKAA